MRERSPAVGGDLVINLRIESMRLRCSPGRRRRLRLGEELMADVLDDNSTRRQSVILGRRNILVISRRKNGRWRWDGRNRSWIRMQFHMRRSLAGGPSHAAVERHFGENIKKAADQKRAVSALANGRLARRSFGR